MGSKKNILFPMNWPDTTGLMLRRAHETYELLAKHLKKQNVTCFIAYPEVHREYTNSALNVVELDCISFKKNKVEIKQFLDQHDIGTILYIDPPFVSNMYRDYRNWGVRSISYVRYSHGFVHMQENTMKTRLKRLVHFTGLFSADTYIAITRSGESKLATAIGIPEKKIAYIRNGIDGAIFPDKIRTPSSINPKVIISVFQMRPQKNILFLLNVIKELSTRRNDFEYIHAGGGEQLDLAQQYAKELGIDHICKFIGPVDTPIDYLYSADVVIHANKAENCSNVITEAMGCGTPVVAVKSDSALEQLTPDIGTVIDELNCEQYCAAIETYLDRPDLRDKAHRLAPHRARTEFSIESQSKGLENLLMSR